MLRLLQKHMPDEPGGLEVGFEGGGAGGLRRGFGFVTHLGFWILIHG